MIERDEPTNLPTTATVDTALYDYYYWDYNTLYNRSGSLSGKWVSAGGSSEGPDGTAYVAFGHIFQSGTGAFSAIGAHLVFDFNGYGHNSGNTNPVTFTNANTEAGDYCFYFLHNSGSVAQNWRNNQYSNLGELGSNYTFQNYPTGRSHALTITRKDSNAFTFDSNKSPNTNNPGFGEMMMIDTHGNTITIPRWGFTNFKMVAECATGTLSVNQLYLYAGTELIAKFTPDNSNELVLKSGSHHIGYKM